jgi:hypothetical protein
MCHDLLRTATRRAVLALLPWPCLAGAGPGCSFDPSLSSGATGSADRLGKMHARRGTGDKRRQGQRSPLQTRQASGRR